MNKNQYERMDLDDEDGGLCCCCKALFTGGDAVKETEIVYTTQTGYYAPGQQPFPPPHQQPQHGAQTVPPGQFAAPVHNGQTMGPPGGQQFQGQQFQGQQYQAMPGDVPQIPKQFVTDDPEDENSKLGRIQFSIVYDFQQKTLTLKIIRATRLVAKDFGGTSDPYVKVILLPDKNTKLTTKIRKKNLNPRWNEVFAFEDYPFEKIIANTLFLQVLDYDRFSKDDPIGEVCIPMSDFDLSNGQTLWKNLQPSEEAKGKLGDLFLSLCYDSANSTIRVTVVKAAHLKAKDINGYSDPYVKIWLLQDGKRMEKKRTSIKEKTLNPIFNETLVFQVSLDRIRSTSLLVAVMDFDRCGRNEAIGQLLLGSKSAPNEVKHWNEMFSKARQDVSQWHVLRDF